jgi:hypothetical protein
MCKCAHGGLLLLAAIAATSALPVAASDADQFNRRAAGRDAAAFSALDRDADGRLTPEEVRGNIDMMARFDDFDINRDGFITQAELERYLLFRYGVALDSTREVPRDAASAGGGAEAPQGSPVSR